MFKRHEFTRLAVMALAALAIGGVLAVGPASAADPVTPGADRSTPGNPWTTGANWLSFSAGYARAGGNNAGDGLGGYGVGYQHMLSKKWSFGASIRHEALGHIGSSYELAVPMTAEFTRHYNWKTALRPYTGFGGGYYFHKYYRTTSDYTGAPGGGMHLSFGANLPIDDRHVLGLDTRVAFVQGRGDGVVNPVFGPEPSSITMWNVMLTWALVN